LEKSLEELKITGLLKELLIMRKKNLQMSSKKKETREPMLMFTG
jgi:hypothetical protein